ncbi:acyl-CoA dehydrogenase family protein [Zavarzinia compransoris]|uniref:Acyl-CoA dehydrogenase n=1 Tax=Zavarzinia compransoris TaxID=1264899 RepID=A0A317DSA7_9PROT|nr:acyl-CoA dehydrogenase family protein [Zavarzinia compransoris]PWR17558.1 acyl-CoA dehydrogenase [Zavarzinia compransoris]TDP49216.1 alkylation response protein AidB-like acyl-CoA dehydrogenase [Zavarzinia compransoris]
MNFAFTEDQLLFRDTVRDFLAAECGPAELRAAAAGTGRSAARWQKLADMGLTGLTVAEARGGLGLGLLDYVLIAEETGRVALPEPLIDQIGIAAPVLADFAARADVAAVLSGLAAGTCKVAAGHPDDPFVADAGEADFLLLGRDGVLHLVPRDRVVLTPETSVDPLRRIAAVDWAAGNETRLSGETGILDRFRDLGALAAAAQGLGLAQAMVDLAADYARTRQQFGKPIGTFQAVKHHLATVQVAIEFARAPVYKAAATQHPRDISHARIAVVDAAAAAARTAIQVFGAMGYTYEVDLHFFMKRAWALAGVWGDRHYHLDRLSRMVLSDDAAIGADGTFQDR